MSNELKVRVSAEYTKNGKTEKLPTVEWLATSTHFVAGALTLSTSYQTIDLGDAAAAGNGVLWVLNESTTVGEYVLVNNAALGVDVIRVYPGECQPCRPTVAAGEVLRMKSAAGTPAVRFWYFDNA